MPFRRYFFIFVFNALTLSGLLGYWLVLMHSHDAMRTVTLARTEQVARQLTSGLAEQMAAVIRNVNFVTSDLRMDYAADRKQFERSVPAAFEAFPEGSLIQVGVIDREGYLAYSSLGASKQYLGDREHFQIHARHPDKDELFVSRPLQGRVSGAWTIQFSRPILRRGQFDGVLVLSISPRYLSRTLANLGLNQNDVAGMVRNDGSYLAHSRRIDDLVGKKVKDNRPYLQEHAGNGGTFSDESSNDSIRRIFAWRRVNDSSQLFVYTGISEADVLAPIESEIATSLRSNLIGSLAILAFAGVITGLWLRLARQQQALGKSEHQYRSFFEKHSSIKLLIDPASGQVCDANAAAAAYYGYPLEQLRGMHIADLNCLPPAEINAEMELAKEEKRNYFLFEHRLANGNVRKVEVYSCPIEIGNKIFLHSIVHDVQDRFDLENRLLASEERYRTIFSTIPNGMILIRGDGEITLWNEAALALLGVDDEGLKTRTVRLHYRNGEPVPPEQYPTRRILVEKQLQGLYYLLLDNGERSWIAVHGRQLATTDGTDACAVISFSDVSRLVSLEESLMISQSVFEAASEGILVTDAENRIVRVNPAFTRITGFSADEVIGKTPALLASGRHDPSYYKAMYDALQQQGAWEGEIINRHKTGRLYVENLKISLVRNQNGATLRHVALLSDITNQKEYEDDILYRAHHDALTGLPNRMLFLDRLKQSLAHAQRNGEQVSVLFIDLDCFKPVNDTHGHAAGDQLLVLVAERIRDCLREEDTVARIGGDEFVVLLTHIRSRQDCVNIAEKIRNDLATPFDLEMATVAISASVGLSLFPEDGHSAEDLLNRADASMYLLKAMHKLSVERQRSER